MDLARTAPSPEICATCGGDGAVFRVQDGRAVAEPCPHTRDCASCGGTGRVFATDQRGYSVLRGCACGADPRRLALLTGLRLPLKFRDRTLDNFKTYDEAQRRAHARARFFVDQFVPQSRGARALLLCGPPGVGKTHLLTAVLRELALRKGVRCRYEEFFLLLSDIRDGFSRGLSSREWLEPLREVEVLAIDEIGKGGKNRDWEQGVLDEIISVRYNANRPTLFATNYPPRRDSTNETSTPWQFGVEGEIKETLEQRVGQRIYSRLHELCDFVEIVTASDFRKEQHDVQRARDSIQTDTAVPAGAHGRPRPQRG